MQRFGLALARIFFWFRVIMLVGSAGAMVGAVLMFWQGSLYLVEAWQTLIGNTSLSEIAHNEEALSQHHSEVTQVTVQVLEAIDSFLFGVVLVIFAYSIAVGFVFRLPANVAKALPTWMKVDGVGQLKQILAEVVIVVLIVIFARTVVESSGQFQWTMLVLPISIILVSAAVWLLELGQHDAEHQNGNVNAPHEPETPPGHHTEGGF